MIIVNLKGGLGNQMFQYALGRALALKNNLELKLDVSGYRQGAGAAGDTIRTFGLSHFNIKGDIATDEEVRRIKYPLGVFSKAWRLVKAKIFRLYYTDYHPELISKITPRTKDFYLDGFFQSKLYFNDIEEVIREDFKLKESLTAESKRLAQEILSKGEDSISLHIRRGDYARDSATTRAWGLAPLEYYSSAAAYVLSKMKEKNSTISPVFFIFSDDMQWVKDNLKLDYPMLFVSGSEIPDYEEMRLMSLCRSHIIANSTFSWWGAWLDGREGVTVIAPKKWSNNVPDDHPNIIPHSWVRM